MPHQKVGLSAILFSAAIVVACDSASRPPSAPSQPPGSDAAPDGSTLKIAAPTLVSPVNGVQIPAGIPLVLTLTNVSGEFASFPVTYEVEVRSAAGTLVANPRFPKSSGSTTSVTVSAPLAGNTGYSWRVRATYSGRVGPWSSTGTFSTGQSAFISGSQVVDPLTTGSTVGRQRGGHFIVGEGWQADTLGDGIDYDITTCSNCRLEFDVTNVGNGASNPGELKWVSMGDATTFNNFGLFRDSPWKMHLEQRSDGDGTGMEIIFRNGGTGSGSPGDNEIRNNTTANWQRNQVFHFVIDWTPAGFFVAVNGQVYLQGTFGGGRAYAPPSHRVSLGCYPRNETQRGAIFRNVTVTPR